MTDPLVSAAEAMVIGARLDGAEIGFAWSLPFIGLLLSIAVVPLLAPYFWERQFGKVAALWTFALLLPCAVVFGLRTTAAQVLHTFLLDYLPFYALAPKRIWPIQYDKFHPRFTARLHRHSHGADIGV